MWKTLSQTFPLSKNSVKLPKGVQKIRSQWLGSRRPISEAEKVLGLVIAAVVGMNPLAAIAGSACWVLPVLFIQRGQAKNIRNLGTPILANVFLTGALVAWDHGINLTALLNLAMAAIICMLMVQVCERIRWIIGLPVLLAPTIGTLGILRSLDLVAPSLNYDFHQVNTTWVAIAAGILLTIYSPLSALLLGLGSAIAMAVSPALATDAVILFAAVFLIIMTAATLPSFMAMVWAMLGSIASLYISSAVHIHAGTSIDLISLMFTINLCSCLGYFGYLMCARVDYFYPWFVRPEDKLDAVYSYWTRFRSGESRIYCPFVGRWSVYQGFSGPWTHQGPWRYSLDFVIKDQRGRSFRTTGEVAADYYGFGQEIISPTSGYVVAMADHFADNEIGTVDNQNKWGNYVIIRDAYGAHVLIAHLKKASLTCSVYQYVEVGQVLGLCGNSGYSPEPHIHIHVQVGPYLGSATLPFHLMNFVSERANSLTFESHAVPSQGDIVFNPAVNAALSRTMSFVIGDRFVIKEQTPLSHGSIEVINALDPVFGTMYLSSGTARLYHAKYGVNFCFTYYIGPKNHPLRDLMIALPRLPLLFDVACNFADSTPSQRQGIAKYRHYARQILAPKTQGPNGRYQFDARQLTVNGVVDSGRQPVATRCTIDPLDGVCDFSADDRRYSMAKVNPGGGANAIGASAINSHGQAS